MRFAVWSEVYYSGRRQAAGRRWRESLELISRNGACRGNDTSRLQPTTSRDIAQAAGAHVADQKSAARTRDFPVDVKQHNEADEHE